MLNLPSSTEFGRRVPKQKFYEHLDVSPEVKRLFIDQIKLITWANKLSPQTMNLGAGQTVTEIEVFHIRLTGQELDKRTLELMDRQIPYHILFVLERPDGQMQLRISYKEASQSGDNAFRLRQSYATEFTPPESLTLPLDALDMDGLYHRCSSARPSDHQDRGDTSPCGTAGHRTHRRRHRRLRPEMAGA